MQRIEKMEQGDRALDNVENGELVPNGWAKIVKSSIQREYFQIKTRKVTFCRLEGAKVLDLIFIVPQKPLIRSRTIVLYTSPQYPH